MKLLDAEKLAKRKMIENGLDDWSFKFDRSKSRFGACWHNRKLISLSKELVFLNDEKDVLDVLLHEIAHACVGKGNGHNWVWRQKAVELGCNPERCYDPRKVITPKKKFVGICPNCEHKVERHKRFKGACGKCCTLHNNNRFTEKFLLNWVINN